MFNTVQHALNNTHSKNSITICVFVYKMWLAADAHAVSIFGGGWIIGPRGSKVVTVALCPGGRSLTGVDLASECMIQAL